MQSKTSRNAGARSLTMDGECHQLIIYCVVTVVYMVRECRLLEARESLSTSARDEGRNPSLSIRAALPQCRTVRPNVAPTRLVDTGRRTGEVTVRCEVISICDSLLICETVSTAY